MKTKPVVELGRDRKFDHARLFLADLHVEAEVFSHAHRAEEWLALVENLHHALLSLQDEYAALPDCEISPVWSSNGFMGRFFANFLRLVSTLSPGELARLDTPRKLAFHGALVGALTLACVDISNLMKSKAA